MLTEKLAEDLQNMVAEEPVGTARQLVEAAMLGIFERAKREAALGAEKPVHRIEADFIVKAFISMDEEVKITLRSFAMGYADAMRALGGDHG